jgi:hypothetical protein
MRDNGYTRVESLGIMNGRIPGGNCNCQPPTTHGPKIAKRHIMNAFGGSLGVDKVITFDDSSKIALNRPRCAHYVECTMNVKEK